MPYKCKECGASFDTRHNLTEHMRIHNCERCECNLCDKSFSNQSNLRAHIRAAHPPQSIGTNTLWSSVHNTFTCGECGRLFDHNEQMAYYQHLSLHTGPIDLERTPLFKTGDGRLRRFR